MAHPLVTYLSRRDRLSGEERALLESLSLRQEVIPARFQMLKQGSRPTHSCLLLRGMAFREHLLRSGKRAISAVHVAGDFMDLHSLLMTRMDHGVTAGSECVVSWVAHADLIAITEQHPHLGRLLWTTTVTDGAIARTAVAVVGRLRPTAQIAHMACELYVRLAEIGLAQDLSFELPITQLDMADMFGLSTVHLNRSMQALRATGVVSWDGNRVRIHDWRKLTEIGEFDPTYLNLEQKAR